MNKFEKQLEKWNHGVLRGAQARLAETLKVSTAIVALWTTGKRRPSKGYTAQMANLFGLDVYAVLRLFDGQSTTYPEPKHGPVRQALREKNSMPYQAQHPEAGESLPPQSNSVSLPLLANPPTANDASFSEEDIIEWWTLPRRAAHGAKYLIAQPGSDDLYFIKPATAYTPQTLTLALADGKARLGRITANGQTLTLTDENGSLIGQYSAQNLRVVGCAVRKISTFPTTNNA